ncbi:hypothetical protein EAF04_002860 [Stromatinia cepivora]|nr:hypothetical protein EAF04_002860 [Stromatinia cepivora]
MELDDTTPGIGRLLRSDVNNFTTASNAITTPVAVQTANGSPAAGQAAATAPATSVTAPATGAPVPDASTSIPPTPRVVKDLGVNQQLVVDETKKRKQEGFEDSRPKRQQPKDTAAVEDVALYRYRELRDDLLNWYYRPRGRDFPALKSVSGSFNATQLAILILKGVNKKGTSDIVLVDAKLDMFSQAPRIRIFWGGYSFSIRSNNVVQVGREDDLWKHKVCKVDLSSDGTIDKTKTELAKVLAADFDCPSQKDVDMLIEFAYENGNSLLEFFGFTLTGPFYWDCRSSSKDNYKEEIIPFLNSGQLHATLVRSLDELDRKSFEFHDDFWKEQMTRTIRDGVYHFHKRQLGDTTGQLFKDWQKTPNLTLTHQIWMRNPRVHFDLKSYASHPARKTFATPRDMEIGLSLGVIGEIMWENVSIGKYFNPNTTHMCLHMKFTVVPLPIEPEAPEAPKAPEAEPGFIVVKGMKKKKKSMPPRGWMPANEIVNARVLAIDTDMDFVLGFQIKDPDQRKAFSTNANLENCIEMERNALPAKRMLQAIGKLCGEPRTHLEKKQQKFLMGHGVENEGPSIYEAYKDQMTKDQRAVFDFLGTSMKMNKQQLRAWELLFYNNCFTSLLQGPPGTGKTRTAGGQGLGLALCGVKTLITAPSNTAAREVMIKLMQMLGGVLTKFPQAEEWFDIVYLPTRSTAMDMREADIDWDTMADHTIQEGENQTGQADVDRYALWRRIVASFEEDSNNKDDAEKQTKAKAWLNVLKAYRFSHRISSKDKKKFYLAAEGKAKDILSSPLSKVKIVVCTCSTAHLLQEYGYQPQASLADEAAFGSEPELIIPAILLIKSTNHNEHSSQLAMSLFERFYDHDSVEIVRFKMNYRMPKVLARFPGMVTYGFLGSHPSTMVESDTLKYYQEWWNSDSAKPYRDARRESEFGGPKNDNPQRLLINVKNGKSAPRQGGKSKRNFANINAIPSIPTIDSTQGGENEIVLLAVTPADQHNGSVIGFIKNWDRMNVGLTRAKSVLIIFGNLDLWRSQLPIITKVHKAKNFGYMIMDVLDLGDVIDVDGDNVLPKTFAQLRNALNHRAQVCLNTHSDPKVKAEYEETLLNELRAMRKAAGEFERLEEVGVEYDLPSFGSAEENTEEIDAEDEELPLAPIDELENLLKSPSVTGQVLESAPTDHDGDVDLTDLAEATVRSEITKENEDRLQQGLKDSLMQTDEFEMDLTLPQNAGSEYDEAATNMLKNIGNGSS